MEGFNAVFRFYFYRSLREPAVLAAVIVSVLLLLLAPLGTAFGFHEQESLVRDVGVSTIFLCAILVSLVCAGIREREQNTWYVLLRPLSRFTYTSGSFAGILCCALLVNAAIGCLGFVVLRTSPEGFSESFAFSASIGAIGGALLWGAWRNLRTGGPFVSAALSAFLLLSALFFLWALWKEWGRGDGELLQEEQVLLVQAELLCIVSALSVSAAAWAGGMLLGRLGGIGLGVVILVLGMVKEELDGLPVFLRLPGELVLPNFDLLYSGDLFYADVLVLPWAYVASSLLYLGVWSAALFLIGSGGFFCRRFSR